RILVQQVADVEEQLRLGFLEAQLVVHAQVEPDPAGNVIVGRGDVVRRRDRLGRSRGTARKYRAVALTLDPQAVVDAGAHTAHGERGAEAIQRIHGRTLVLPVRQTVAVVADPVVGQHVRDATVFHVLDVVGRRTAQGQVAV